MTQIQERYLSIRNELIGDLLEKRNELESFLEEKEPEKVRYDLEKRKLILSNLQEIESIELNKNHQAFIVHMKELELFLDRGSIRPGNFGNFNDARFVVYVLWLLGFYKFYTSKPIINITGVKPNASNINISTHYEHPVSANPHDFGMNCWGGWKSEVVRALTGGDVMEVLMIISNRMKQVNLSDSMGHFNNLERIRTIVNDKVSISDETVRTFKEEILFLLNRTDLTYSFDFESSDETDVIIGITHAFGINIEGVHTAGQVTNVTYNRPPSHSNRLELTMSKHIYDTVLLPELRGERIER